MKSSRFLSFNVTPPACHASGISNGCLQMAGVALVEDKDVAHVDEASLPSIL